MYLEHYKNVLGEIPEFLYKYLEVPSLVRLKKIGFFCGMDYASDDVYNFSEYISRFDHSLTVALMTYKLTGDKRATLAGLFHDISTPCFSHVIDYMNEDFTNQESTEEYTEDILRGDSVLLKCLEEDGIDVCEVADFKKYRIVDCERPHMCVDRIDGIILTGIGWCCNVDVFDIDSIVNDLVVYKNNDGDDEVGFKSSSVCSRVLEINDSIDFLCHSSFDNYMMTLLSNIARLGIKCGLFSYEELYSYDEDTLFDILNKSDNVEIKRLLNKFYNILKRDIPDTVIPNVKKRVIRPIVNGNRI